MVDVQLHFQGNDTQRHKMPTVPRQGDYITHEGRLWRVAYVVLSEPSTTRGRGMIDLYVVQVADDRRDELERIWTEWSLCAKGQKDNCVRDWSGGV